MGKSQRRHSNQFKRDVVDQIEAGLISQSEAARQHDVSPSLITRWRRQIRENTLVDHPTAREKALEKELERYKKKVGELTLANDLLKKIQESSRRAKKLSESVVSPRTLDRSKELAK
jgi:transposase-like protein